MPPAATLGGARGGVAPAGNGVSDGESFQLPELTPAKPQTDLLSTSAASQQAALLQETFHQDLDLVVQKFLKEMEKKTGLGAESLMAGLSSSLQKVPHLQEMVKAFTQSVQAVGQEQGIEVPLAEVDAELKGFLKELQSLLGQQAALSEEPQAAPVDPKFQFSVLNTDQAREVRSREIVERIQKNFFDVQGERSAVGGEQGGILGEKFKAPLKSEFISTENFFKAREQDLELKAKLQGGAEVLKLAEETLAPASQGLAPLKSLQTENSSDLSFTDSLLQHMSVSSPTSVQPGGASVAASTTESISQELSAALAGEPEVIDNLHEIVQRARATARAGGGEMEMELRPEGLGKVQVKVSVEGDQVQVQMVAESKRVQDLLQEGLQDLRASLAAQKLQSETLAVSSPEASDGASLNGREAEADQRSFAQGFMRQFREDREAARSGQMRFPAAAGAGSSRSTNVVQPLNTRAHEGRLSLIA